MPAKRRRGVVSLLPHEGSITTNECIITKQFTKIRQTIESTLERERERESGREYRVQGCDDPTKDWDP